MNLFYGLHPKLLLQNGESSSKLSLPPKNSVAGRVNSSKPMPTTPTRAFRLLKPTRAVNNNGEEEEEMEKSAVEEPESDSQKVRIILHMVFTIRIICHTQSKLHSFLES